MERIRCPHPSLPTYLVTKLRRDLSRLNLTQPINYQVEEERREGRPTPSLDLLPFSITGLQLS